MSRLTSFGTIGAVGLLGAFLHAQQPAPAAPAAPAQAAPAQPQPYFVGNALGLPINPAPDGKFAPMSSNVKVYGSVYLAESCSYDSGPRSDRGAQSCPAAEHSDQQRLDLVFQSRRVGAHVAVDRHPELRAAAGHTAAATRPQRAARQRHHQRHPLHGRPRRRNVAHGIAVSVVRKFDMKTGAPAGEVRVPQSTGFNDIEVAEDGTIYGTQTGTGGQNPDRSLAGLEDHARWQVVDLRAGRSASTAQRHRVR